MRFSLAVFTGLLLGLTSVAQADPYEPQPGSDARRDLLDQFRPLAIYDLGAPIEFRVLEIMIDGDTAFARLMAQRPGGGEIDMTDTPMVEWRFVNPYEIDGPRFEVFYLRDGGQWQPVNYGLGSSDVWWWAHRCDVFGSLLQEYGC